MDGIRSDCSTREMDLMSGHSNVTSGCIAAVHGWFNGNEGTLAPPGEYD